MNKGKTLTPLTPAVLYILLALAATRRHGYGIMKQIEADTGGKVKMGPGTLYGSLSRMIDAGLVRESAKETEAGQDDRRRIYYELTGAGRAALEAELKRYDEIVALGRQKAIFSFAGSHDH